MNIHIYKDKTKSIGQFFIKLGNIYLLDEMRLINSNFLYQHFIMGICTPQEKEALVQSLLDWMVPYATRFAQDGGQELLAQLGSRTTFDYQKQLQYLSECEEMIKDMELGCCDKEIVEDEYHLTIQMLKVSLFIRNYVEQQETIGIKQRQRLLSILKKELETMITDFKKCWLLRNKYSLLDNSTKCFDHVLSTIASKLATLY